MQTESTVSNSPTEPARSSLPESRSVRELLMDDDFGGSYYQFGVGSWCKIGLLTAAELVSLYKADAALPESRRLIKLDSATNDSPAMGDFLLLAQQVVDLTISGQVPELIAFGGYRHGGSIFWRDLCLDTVYVNGAIADSSGVVAAKLNLIRKELLNHSPDEVDPEPLIGDGWQRIWWD